MARSLKRTNYDGKRIGTRRTNTLGEVRHAPGETKKPNQTKLTEKEKWE